MVIRKAFTGVITAALLATGLVAGESAQAAESGVGVDVQNAPTYHVGDTIVVRVGYLPKTYRKHVREAVQLLNQYTTSNVQVRKWCGQLANDWCVTIRETEDWSLTSGGAAATHWHMRTRIHTDGHSESTWMGKEVYVHRNYRNAGRESLRGMIAHELGHTFTLPHHQQTGCDKYKGYDQPADIMGNNGQGSKKVFRVGWASVDPDTCERTAGGARAALRTI